jgi:release factor glutamine methyltransferase
MGVNIQTIKDIRFYLSKELESLYKEPEISALTNIIITTALSISKLHELHTNDHPVTREQADKIITICEELKTGKPIQYILGETYFYNCIIQVNSSTLIPRQETEELVDLIIRENREFTGNIIDFGTGSGCIAIALAANLPKASVTGIDISEKALKTARINGVLNNVRVEFLKGDILCFNYGDLNKPAIIVSNPPYVRMSEKALMSKNVLDFEPHEALFISDSNPLEYYEAILKLAENILLPGGRIYFEINEKMGTPMAKMFDSFGYKEIEIVADLNGKERIIKGRKDD